MSNVLAFPQERVKGPRITMSCEVYEFPTRPKVVISFHPWLWFFGLSISWKVNS